MTPCQAFDAFAASLVGLPISHVWRGYGSAIFLEFGRLRAAAGRIASAGQPVGEISLGVEWSWRIEDPTTIRCGSWSEEPLWEPALDALRNALVARCDLFGSLPEIAITTDAHLRFLSFSTTDGQPRWHMVDRRDGPAQWFTVRAGKLHLGNGREPVE